MQKRIKEIFNAEARAIESIPVTDIFEEVIEIMYQQVHVKRGKVITSGMGKAGEIANNIATTFSSTGTPSVFLHPSDAQHGDLGIIREHDVLFLISNSGKTREIVELVNLSKRLVSDITLIVVTGNPDSPLAGVTNLVLLTGNPDEVCPLGLTPTTSTTVMTVLGDALVVCLMEKIGFTAHDYALRHHGGYLGDKSRLASGDPGNDK
jgi:arabinose-5-phosphate isomerase